jgi:4-amino-4-deoxy-L-arabinose transferase-like glycosyltransferase
MSVMLRWLRRARLEIVGVLIFAALVCGVLWTRNAGSARGLSAVYRLGLACDGPVLEQRVDRRLVVDQDREPLLRRSNVCVDWTGSLVVPEAGRYILGTTSDDGSWVHLDGQQVVDNGGLHAQETRHSPPLWLEPGPHAIRVRLVQAAGGAKLVLHWQPPGRRWYPETIPESLLLPRSPTELGAAAPTGWPTADGWRLLALWLAALALLGVLLRRQWAGPARDLLHSPALRSEALLAVGLFGAALAYRLWDLSAAGLTWDEPAYFSASHNAMSALLAGDLGAEAWRYNAEHPGLAKWLYGVPVLLGGGYPGMRLVSAIAGSATCVVAYLAGRTLFSKRVGVLAALLLAVLPAALAHHKIGGLESPSGLLYAATVYAGLAALRREQAHGAFVTCGVLLGLAVSVRLTNVTSALVIAGLYLLWHRETIVRTRAVPLPLGAALAPMVAALVFVLAWPRLWHEPFHALVELLSGYNQLPAQEYFFGELRQPPAHYLVTYVAATTPVSMLAALGLFAARGMAQRRWSELAVTAWLLGPLLASFSPVIRDGLRYGFPVLVPLCTMAAAGIDWLGELVVRAFSQRAGRWAFGGGSAIVVAATVHGGLSVHPYYLDYYNLLVGGPEGAKRDQRLEFSWWGEGLEAAAAYVSRVAPRDATVLLWANPKHTTRFRRDLRVTSQGDADYVIANGYLTAPFDDTDYQVAHRIRVRSAALVTVYKRSERQPLPAAPTGPGPRPKGPTR